jgi:hypothetical protein
MLTHTSFFEMDPQRNTNSDISLVSLGEAAEILDESEEFIFQLLGEKTLKQISRWDSYYLFRSDVYLYEQECRRRALEAINATLTDDSETYLDETSSVCAPCNGTGVQP